MLYNTGADKNRQGVIVLPLRFPLTTGPAPGQLYGHFQPPGLPHCLPWLEKAIPARKGNRRKERPEDRVQVFSPRDET